MADDNNALVNQDGETNVVPAKKKLSGKVLILFIVLPVVLLAGIGTATYFLVFANKGNAEAAEGHDEKGDHAEKDGHGKKDDKKKGEKKEEKKGGHGAPAEGGDGAESADGGIKTSEGPNGETFLTLPDIIVNITNAENRPTFLKLRLSLQVKDPETAEAIKPLYPVIKDRYTAFLRELRMEDLQGSAGYSRLQLELLKRTNLAIAPAQVDAVLIEEMLVN